MIPQDEAHRFLNWQRTRDHCIAWGQHFENTGAPYVIVQTEEGWTIYKHQYQNQSGWCCGATA
jgi:hypothetical protein